MLGFTEQEKFDCYMLTAGVMTFGGVEFKTKGRDDQAECEHTGPSTYPGKAASLMGVDAYDMIKAFKEFHIFTLKCQKLRRTTRWWTMEASLTSLVLMLMSKTWLVSVD